MKASGSTRSDQPTPSTLSKPTRINVKDCSEAVAGANLPNAILTGCNLAGADLIGANLYGANPDLRANLRLSRTWPSRTWPSREPDPGGPERREPGRREPDRRGPERREPGPDADLYGVTGWDTVKGKGSIVGLDAAINVPG